MVMCSEQIAPESRLGDKSRGLYCIARTYRQIDIASGGVCGQHVQSKNANLCRMYGFMECIYYIHAYCVDFIEYYLLFIKNKLLSKFYYVHI